MPATHSISSREETRTLGVGASFRQGCVSILLG